MDKGIEKWAVLLSITFLTSNPLEMRSISPKHEKLASDFYALLSDPHLSVEMISNTVVLSQSALWKHCMPRHTPAPYSRYHHPVPGSLALRPSWGSLRHLLDIHVDLLEVSMDELKDPPPMDGLGDLAQRISASFMGCMRSSGTDRLSGAWYPRSLFRDGADRRPGHHRQHDESQVLFQSADLTGSTTLRTIATTHADTTITTSGMTVRSPYPISLRIK